VSIPNISSVCMYSDTTLTAGMVKTDAGQRGAQRKVEAGLQSIGPAPARKAAKPLRQQDNGRD